MIRRRKRDTPEPHRADVQEKDAAQTGGPSVYTGPPIELPENGRRGSPPELYGS
jgi:hypothetical protein